MVRCAAEPATSARLREPEQDPEEHERTSRDPDGPTPRSPRRTDEARDRKDEQRRRAVEQVQEVRRSVSQREQRQTEQRVRADEDERDDDRAVEPAAGASGPGAQRDGGDQDEDGGDGRQDGEGAVDARHRGRAGRIGGSVDPGGTSVAVIPARARRLAGAAGHRSPRNRSGWLGLAAGLAIAAGLVIVLARVLDPPTAVGASPSATVADVATGKNLYLQSCATCHGAQGQGGLNGPPIANAGAALADFVLRTGRMPLANPSQPMVRQQPIFDQQQIDALVAYVASLGPGPAIPTVQTNGADLAAGQRLYAANCAACHGAGGSGGTVGNAVAPSLDQADALTVAEAVLTGPIPMPRFVFSQTELNNLAAYVLALRDLPHPGGLQIAEIGPVAEGFLAGFVGVVTLLAIARWIASARPDRPADAEDEP